MTFLEIQSATLDEEHQPPRNPSRANILDQIKRSAGSTPAKSGRNNKNLCHRHREFNIDGDSFNMLNNVGTDDGFAGYGITPHPDHSVLSCNGDVSLFRTSSSHTSKDEVSMMFNNTHGIEEKLYHINTHYGKDGTADLDNAPTYDDLGPAQRMFKILDSHRTLSTEENTAFTPLQSVASRSSSIDDTVWDDERVGEPTSLLDDTDGEDDDYSNNDTCGDMDDGSLYGSVDYDDDETLQSNDLSKAPLTAVESFLDELGEVESVHGLGTLLYQVGSCNFQADNQYTDDDITVNSEVFPTACGNFQNSNQTSNTLPATTLNHDSNPPFAGTRKSILEGTTDAFAHILHNISITTESILDILGSPSTQVQQQKSGSTPSDSCDVNAPTPNDSTASLFQSVFKCHG